MHLRIENPIHTRANKLRTFVSVLTLASATTFSGVAWAEFGEMVVSSQKRDELLQDVSASITALDSGQLEFRGVSSTLDLVQYIPNLVYSEQTGAALVSIRGVGLGVDTAAAEPGVAMHVDGVYQPRATTSLLNSADLAQMEVLRGPQGTLYGRNATGGVINFISNKPTEEFEGEATLSMGNFGRYGGKVTLSGPLIEDKLLGRLLLIGEERDGYIENTFLGKDEGERSDRAARASFTWLASEDLTVDLSLHYQNTETAPSSVAITPPTALDEGIALSMSPPGTVLIANTTDFQISEEIIGEGEIENWGGTLVVNWDLGGVNVKSTTGYIESSVDFFGGADGLSLPLVTLDRMDKSTSISQEVIVSGSFGKVDWLVGGYFSDEDYNVIFDFPNLLLTGLDFKFQGIEDIRSIAGFADATVSLTEELRVFGGVRVSGDKKSISQTEHVLAGGVAIADQCPLFAVPTVLKFKKKWTSVTPRGGIEYDFTDKVMGYAQYQQGFKAGGFNFAGACGNGFKPEKITSYEAGFKTSFADDRVTVNASAFFYDYKNLQVFSNLATATIVTNAPKSEVKGVEVEVFAEPVENFQINLAATYLDTEYKVYSEDNIITGGILLEDLSGNKLNRAPKYTISAGIQNTWPIQSGLLSDFTLRGEVYHTDDVHYRSFNAPEDTQKAYTLFNLFAEVTTVDEHVKIRGYAKNLTDEGYFIQIQAGGMYVDGYRKGQYGNPRTYGFEAVFSY